MPGFDGIGANEYIVDVTHPGALDFISAGHAVRLGAQHLVPHVERRLPDADRRRDRFPVIYDGRVGMGRTYSKIDGPMSYLGWLKGLQSGHSYVSDGKDPPDELSRQRNRCREQQRRSPADRPGDRDPCWLVRGVSSRIAERGHPQPSIRREAYWDVSGRVSRQPRSPVRSW